MLCGIALSRLGIMPEQFYTLSPLEFLSAIKDKDSRERVTLEAQIHSIYEAVRLHGMWSYNFVPAKKKPMTDPTKLCKFPWDKEHSKEMSVEQMKTNLLSFARAHNKKTNRNLKTNEKKA